MKTRKMLNVTKTAKIWITESVESASDPRSASLSQYLVQVLCFFVLLFLKVFFFLQGQWDIAKQRLKLSQKLHQYLRQYLVHLGCTTWLDQILTQPWTRCWPQHLFDKFASFLLFLVCWNHYCYSDFSKALPFLGPPPPPKLGTLFVSTTALIDFSFSGVILCVFVCFPCPLFSR